MHVRNHTSRYHLAMEVYEKLAAIGRIPYEEAKHAQAGLQQKIDDNTAYIKKNGVDMPEIDAWQWKR